MKDVWAQSGGYTADPIAGSHVLALGQILDGMTPDSPPAEDKKQMPVAWYRTYQGGRPANRGACSRPRTARRRIC